MDNYVKLSLQRPESLSEDSHTLINSSCQPRARQSGITLTPNGTLGPGRIKALRKDDIGTRDGMLHGGEFLGESNPSPKRGVRTNLVALITANALSGGRCIMLYNRYPHFLADCHPRGLSLHPPTSP